MEWEQLFERIIFARFESECQNTKLIQAYTPTNEDEKEIKKDFYHRLQTAFDKRKARDLIIATGDLNAKVGSDNSNR